MKEMDPEEVLELAERYARGHDGDSPNSCVFCVFAVVAHELRLWQARTEMLLEEVYTERAGRPASERPDWSPK